MIEPLMVAPGERGLVRVFAMQMPPEQARFLQEEPAGLDQLLGITPLDHVHTEVIRLSDLEGLGLVGYLIEGCGVPRDEIGGDEAMLDALEGWVLVVRSKAFAGKGGALAPDPALHLVGTYRETTADWSSGPTPTSESAKPYSGVSPRTARAQARRIGATWFVVVMTLIIGGVLWWALT